LKAKRAFAAMVGMGKIDGAAKAVARCGNAGRDPR
jgi:hypothetical protein